MTDRRLDPVTLSVLASALAGIALAVHRPDPLSAVIGTVVGASVTAVMLLVELRDVFGRARG